MSDNHEEAHTGPIQTPKAFAWLVFLSFVGPVFIIIGLVNYVVSGNKPAAGASNPAESVAARIEKVGAVQVKDANRPLKTGEEVFKAQCSACHAAGLAGSPKFGDTAAWAPRIKSGYEALLNSALKGKGAMGAQGGGDFDDLEIGRAVVHMVNNAGGKMAEPKKPEAAK
jgi:cytochrome c5